MVAEYFQARRRLARVTDDARDTQPKILPAADGGGRVRTTGRTDYTKLPERAVISREDLPRLTFAQDLRTSRGWIRHPNRVNRVRTPAGAEFA